MNDPLPEPANLRFLRRLVTVLTATMILGVLVIIALLVIRLQTPGLPPLPDHITLPDGTRPTAFTRGPDWVAVVSDNNEILIFDVETGALRQRIAVE